jgi:toxin ParE1/3/4
VLEYTLSVLARDDYASILEYTLKIWGKNQYETYAKILKKAFTVLSENPTRGRPLRLQKFPLRSYLYYRVESHIIIYKDAGASIEIIRILHKSMNVAQHLSPAESEPSP